MRAPRADDRDRIAADVMSERLQLAVALREAEEELRALRIIGSPVQEIRSCFDLMSYDSEHDWEVAARRMARVPESIAGFETSLRTGMNRGIVAAHRQAIGCAQQAATWGGESDGTPFFVALVAKHSGDPKLHEELERVGVHGNRRVRATREVPPRRVRAQGRPERSRRPRALRVVRPVVQRHRARSRRDVRLGLGGALPDRRAHARSSPSASFRARRSSRSATISTTTPAARSKASMRSGSGTRTSSTRRSPSSTAPTSTLRSPCGAARR